MPDLKFGNKAVTINKDGFLADMNDWNEDIALVLASREGMEKLASEQLDILRFMRGYYEKYHAFPNLKFVCKSIGQSRECVNDEFINPEHAWKIAGLPKMDGIHFVSFDGKHFTMEECC